MRYVFNKITIVVLAFISLCLMVIGFLFQTILIPLQDFDSISKPELLELRKELALNYSLGTGLLYLGIFLMVLVIILSMMKFINKKVI